MFAIATIARFFVGRFFIKFIIPLAIVGILATGVFYYRQKVENYKTKFNNCMATLEIQKSEIKKCNDLLTNFKKQHDILLARFDKNNETYLKAIAKYRTLLMECQKNKAKTKIIIKTVEREDCPKIQLIEINDGLLEKLNKIFKHE